MVRVRRSRLGLGLVLGSGLEIGLGLGLGLGLDYAVKVGRIDRAVSRRNSNVRRLCKYYFEQLFSFIFDNSQTYTLIITKYLYMFICYPK